MKVRFTALIFIFSLTCCLAQLKPTLPTVFATAIAKSFSKDIALHNSKKFLFNYLGVSADIVQFEVIPLAATHSGELTTLLYRCEAKEKEGLVLGFYGDYWNEAGVNYQGFGFKHIEKEKAVEFLNKIQWAIDNNSYFLKTNIENNNIYFKFEDIDVLIWSGLPGEYTIRLFWNDFDSEWEKVAFLRSRKRFEKKIK